MKKRNSSSYEDRTEVGIEDLENNLIPETGYPDKSELGSLAERVILGTSEPQSQENNKDLAPTTALDRYLAEVRRYPFLTKEEELQLFHEYHVQGNREAAVKLILSNLRVSLAIASEYAHTGADQMDLVQEGNVGLMQAIKKFDPSRNVRFHAYAAWWARAYILRYLLNTFRLVKIGTTQDQRKLFYNLKKEKSNPLGIFMVKLWDRHWIHFPLQHLK